MPICSIFFVLASLRLALSRRGTPPLPQHYARPPKTNWHPACSRRTEMPALGCRSSSESGTADAGELLLLRRCAVDSRLECSARNEARHFRSSDLDLLPRARIASATRRAFALFERTKTYQR